MMNNSELNIWDMLGLDDEDNGENNSTDEASSEDSRPSQEVLDRILRGLAAHNSSFTKDDDDDDDDDEINITENDDADDIHNKSCDFARKGQFDKAAHICIKGIERFPNNVDLIADTINYLGKQGNFSAAHDYLMMQRMRLPMSAWNWRSFTFAIDFLVSEDPLKNYEQARQLAEEYMSYLPFEERAYTALYDVEKSVGNHTAALAALERAVKEHPAAEQCSLRLADKLLESGNFARAREIAIRAIAASAQSQPGIRSPYALLVLCLAEDAMMWKNIADGAEPDPHQIKLTLARYGSLESELSHRLVSYHREISDRISMLKVLLAGCEPVIASDDSESEN